MWCEWLPQAAWYSSLRVSGLLVSENVRAVVSEKSGPYVTAAFSCAPPCSSHGRLANIYPFVRHCPVVLDDGVRWAAWALIPSWSIVTILGMLTVSPLCTLSLRTVIEATELLTTVGNSRRFMDLSGMFFCLEKYDEGKGRRAAAQSCKHIPAQRWASDGLTASQTGCPISA